VGRECPRQGQHRETRQPSFPFYKFVFPLPCLIIESVFERKKEKTQDSEYPSVVFFGVADKDLGVGFFPVSESHLCKCSADM